LIAFLHLWLKFCKGIDKYWIVPVRKLFYFHHWLYVLDKGILTIVSMLCPMTMTHDHSHCRTHDQVQSSMSGFHPLSSQLGSTLTLYLTSVAVLKDWTLLGSKISNLGLLCGVVLGTFLVCFWKKD